MTPDPSPTEHSPDERNRDERSADDQDRGWGADLLEDLDADDAHEAWLRAQRPPHHGG